MVPEAGAGMEAERRGDKISGSFCKLFHADPRSRRETKAREVKIN